MGSAAKAATAPMSKEVATAIFFRLKFMIFVSYVFK
jgi:hypothetical protein